MIAALKRLISSDRRHSASPTVGTILNLTIGRGFGLEALDLRTLAADSAFPEILAKCTCDGYCAITAQGLIELEDGTFVHRLYTDEHVMLQVLADRRDPAEAVGEITAWVPCDSAYPSTAADIEGWRQRLRQKTFAFQEQAYARVWFENSDQPEEPVRMVERVWDNLRQVMPPRQIAQTTMVYGRPLASGRRELLLVNIEEADGETTVALMLGLQLTRSMLIL